MNILYVNTNFHEGGAAKIAKQLYYGMKERGHNVYFLAGYPSKGDEECIILNPSVFLKLYNIGTGVLQNNQVVFRRRARKIILDIVREKKIDIVHFHNLFENYIGIKDIDYISRQCKVVWTLHDMWAVTGHCAHSYYCEDWKTGCTHCKEKRLYPAFYYNDVQYKFKLKRKYFANKNIIYVTPSHWLEQICRKSYLKNETIHVIENGINIECYKPLEQKRLREKYEVTEEKVVLFFTATVVQNQGKGLQYLLEALKKIPNRENYVLFVAGKGEVTEKLQGFTVRHMGFINNAELMNEMYNLADIYITTSMADTFPCTVLEAAAAGTAVIAFTSGGIAEIVTEQIGWPVEPGNEEKLYRAIIEAADKREVLVEKGNNARKRAEALYSEQRMLNNYEELYKKLSK